MSPLATQRTSEFLPPSPTILSLLAADLERRLGVPGDGSRSILRLGWGKPPLKKLPWLPISRRSKAKRAQCPQARNKPSSTHISVLASRQFLGNPLLHPTLPGQCPL